MVYVDDLWLRPAGSKLKQSCHLMADSPEELEAFAGQLGIPKSWKHHDHYDLSPARRCKAVLAGARQISTREMVRRFRQGR